MGRRQPAVGRALQAEMGAGGGCKLNTARCALGAAGLQTGGGSSNLEQGPIELALANDRGERSGPQFTMQWHRDSDRSDVGSFLHDAMTSFLPHGNKTMLPEEGAHRVS